MKIAIASDHGGFHLKQAILNFLEEKEYLYQDFGCYSTDSVDFPEYARLVSKEVVQNQSLGILCCGTGIGMSIAANKVHGVRASVVSDPFSAIMTRKHNNSNIICLGERTLGKDLALLLLDLWLSTEFEGGRHQKRLEKME
ncbi:ribose 5-phosphate isomerase B [Listeria fleischmannii]|uniref:Ribose 5-phosphate isomerase B n=1 Tax=Listeria fleischmannii TaxID=1069827 RepID=A0A841YGG3_9LIST|nr:ribose 5-phosphate isomerase B [Listeria fleischmannii]EIA20501.1 ribose 5-phosphate isomerase B [Listeria fleischmannii subsp. coloradonensis]MBC1399391.1 ribose 5-phosphate isomerase B [Listeria fleischmannii]MBC1418081.1 ribose 5-phosphate isomerase B [Listeria fleischmannii]MBC1427674.1 ribose 5-phosphate isomerase B [Listeria fleischmannii]STY35845.1 Ribose-5-phosphate isomerase B [Listeria fleischmannii subsp. coloradonensis]